MVAPETRIHGCSTHNGPWSPISAIKFFSTPDVPDVTTPEMSSYYSITENGKLELNLCRFTENALVRVVQSLHVFNGISIYDG